MALIDCFLYFQERECLELRLRELAGRTAALCAVEAAWTFQGVPREPRFQADLAALAARGVPLPPHIEYLLLVDPVETANPRLREAAQRDAMATAAARLAPAADTIILLSDVDEIPAAATLPATLAPGETYRLCGWIYRYFLNLQVAEPHWHGTRLVRWDDLQQTTPQLLRGGAQGQIHYPEDRPGGWHFSFLGGAAAIRRKLDAWCEEHYWQSSTDDLDRFLADLAGGDLRAGFERIPPGDWLPACVQADPAHYSLLQETPQ